LKIDLGKILPAIILASITATVLSVGSGYLFQGATALSESQELEIQTTNDFVIEDAKLTSGTAAKSTIATNLNTGTFEWSSLLTPTSYVVGGATQNENIIGVQLSLDRTPPTVTKVNPVNRASNVLPTSTISATFSEEVRQNTVTTRTFTLTDSDGNPVPGTVSIVRDHRTQPPSFGASFRPSSPLQVGEIYTAAITNGIKDMANIPLIAPNGNAMTPRMWTFMVTSPGTTAPPGTVPPPVGPTGVDRIAPTVLVVAPVDGSSNVNPNAIIGARFSEQVQRSTVSLTTFTLTDSDGNPVQGTIIRPSSPSNAITTATFDPVSPLLIGETYTASITQGIRDIAGNAMAPHTWSFTIGDTNAPAAGGDTNAPTVLAVTPGDGTTGVPSYTSIRVTLSEPVRKSTVSTTTFMLKDITGNAVPGTILLPAGASISAAIFDPSSPLVTGQRYTAEITNGVIDLAGTALTPKKWSFTVGSSAGQPTGGTSAGPARVLFTQPADRAEEVVRNTVITVRLSKQIDPSTLSTSTFILNDRSGNSVPGTVYAQQAGTNTIAIFDPSSQLRADERYSVQITDGVEDATGTPIIPKRWSFTTR
jgi:hypothetical protein